MTRTPYDIDLDKNPANYAPLTPLSFLERAAYVYPQRLSVVHGAERHTWSQTYQRARRLASALARRGIGVGDTAYAHRGARFALNIPSVWADPAEDDRNIRWTRDLFDAMSPYSSGVYVNFLGTEGEERVRAAYRPETYERLSALKRKYDPANFFRLNQNIKPGPAPRRRPSRPARSNR